MKTFPLQLSELRMPNSQRQMVMSLLWQVLFLSPALLQADEPEADKPPAANVLFIVADDLNCAIGPTAIRLPKRPT